MDVVIVESPAKAKTINKYLGGGFKVLASYGHVRDLPAKKGSVDPDHSFAMTWEIDEKSETRLREISKAVKGTKMLFLATDPDREGEAIAWHVLQELMRRDALDGVEVKRIVFTEVTPSAVRTAMEHPRDLDENLIDAYRARRALDYLVGFTLSPVLWRKLPGSRSAGRVQSVALRLICERETEIESFRSQEYWSLEAEFETAGGKALLARLNELEGRKLDKFDLDTAERADAAKRAIEHNEFHVVSVETKETRRHPAPPFTTSTLQQEASRKLGFGAKRTMQLAQRLYEGIDTGGETAGLITYMRTDGVQIASVAVEACRDLIGGTYGADYLPDKPRLYKSRAKNAQEAHEAIRPTDVTRRPEELAGYLDSAQLKLYDLIWKRTLASQMESAKLEQGAINVAGRDDGIGLRATGTVIVFDGFLRLYQEGEDETALEGDDEARVLPRVERGEELRLKAATPSQHFTQPPPRFTEASLVKRLEELGIGRPSTYASTLSVLQERKYVRMEKRRFEPEDRGRLVTAFLVSFFRRYVQYDFTARLEEELDEISAGQIDWTVVLDEFWKAFREAVDETEKLRVKDVLNAVDDLMGPHIFPLDASGRDPRACPSCADGRLNLKLGKFGPFVGCSTYPECRYTRALIEEEGGSGKFTGPRVLGVDPDTNLEVSVRKGPYGCYIQLGEATEEEKRPKRVSLPKKMSPDEIELEQALVLLSLPREVGLHPETGKPITADIGRFGPYISHDGNNRSLGGEDDAFAIGINRAVALLAEPRKGRGSSVVRELGAHPKDSKPVTLRTGRYGPYVNHAGKNAGLSDELSEESVTLEDAIALLDAKPDKAPRAKRGGTKTARKKSAAGKKSATRKKAATGKKRRPKAASKSKAAPKDSPSDA